MVEVERKFRLSAEQYQAIEQYFKSKENVTHEIQQIDEVFLLGINSFADFKQGMPVMRLRSVDAKTQLTFKRGVNDSGDSIEHELVVESFETMRQILLEMGYHPITTVDKVRKEMHDGNVTLVLDRVKDLGNFLEIEIMAHDEKGISEATEDIMAKAAEFGLVETDIEPRKYDKLMTELATN